MMPVLASYFVLEFKDLQVFAMPKHHPIKKWRFIQFNIPVPLKWYSSEKTISLLHKYV